jgi:hypothetical protein
LNEWDNNPA